MKSDDKVLQLPCGKAMTFWRQDATRVSAFVYANLQGAIDDENDAYLGVRDKDFWCAAEIIATRDKNAALREQLHKQEKATVAAMDARHERLVAMDAENRRLRAALVALTQSFEGSYHSEEVRLYELGRAALGSPVPPFLVERSDGL